MFIEDECAHSCSSCAGCGHSHEDIGIEEYFDKGGVTIIEWADMIKDILPEERLDIKIKIADDNTRILILKPHGEKYVNICEAII